MSGTSGMGGTGADQPTQPQRWGPHAGARKVRSKVKSGCRTCKIRKVKCDEGRPSCARCVSTGRVCDGYGVWGGGGGARRPGPEPGPGRTSSAVVVATHHPSIPGPLRLAVAPASAEEKYFLEWYRLRAAVKMQGAFRLPFWGGLVLRAGLHEPAVFHAMLALSSVHRRVSAGAREVGPRVEPDAPERFTLRHYGRAMALLVRRRGGAGREEEGEADGASRRVALVACMVFVCMELLRGRYRTANRHLRSRMGLLAELPDGAHGGGDDCVVEAFACMNLLAAQLGQGHWTAPAPVVPPTYRRMPILFESPAQARKGLDSLVADVLHLVQRGRLADAAAHSGGSVPAREEFLHAQEGVKSGLAAWLDTYRASMTRFDIQLDAVQMVGCHVLHLHHIMAGIMACTSLQPDDELAYDSHCRDFAELVALACKVRGLVRAVHELGDPVIRSGSELSLFTADIGWAPPLYFTAIHCRVRHVRLYAIKLLRTLPSKEGFWCSALAASVAEEVVRIEEGADGLGDDLGDNAGCFDTGSLDFESSPFGLEASQRVFDVQIVLPDSPQDQTVLVCKRIDGDGGYQVITKGRHGDSHGGIAKDRWKEIGVRPERTS